MDETYIGGKPQRMNHKTRVRCEAKYGPIQSGRGTHKIPVVTMIEKHSGQARSVIMPSVTIETLSQHFKENVVTSRSLLWTDTLPAYFQPGSRFVLHEMVNHNISQYMTKTGATTNKAENFFGQLKRSLDGTHHHVTVKHLARYLAEYDYRYSTRKITDTERMAKLVGATPLRRLSYAQVR